MAGDHTPDVIQRVQLHIYCLRERDQRFRLGLASSQLDPDTSFGEPTTLEEVAKGRTGGEPNGGGGGERERRGGLWWSLSPCVCLA